MSVEPGSNDVNEKCYLQLIVSKCKCEFYIIDYDDRLSNGEEDEETGLLTKNDFGSFNWSVNKTRKKDLNSILNDCIDCITLIHHDLDLCTNSKQYKMIMNLVNSLVLYFRPRRKQIIDKQKSIKFNLQLSQGNLSSLKQHTQLKQLEAKQLLFKLRMLERKLYRLRERIGIETNEYNCKFGGQLGLGNKVTNTRIYTIYEMRLENKSMDKEYNECKKMLNDLSDELNISINCYKEMMLEQRAFNLANTPLFGKGPTINLGPFMNSLINRAPSPSKLADLDQQAQQSILNNEIGRRYEIWFKKTQWKLLDDKDNNNSLAKFMLSNFFYTKVTNQQELDCVEHNLEIESCRIKDMTGSNDQTAMATPLKKKCKPGRPNDSNVLTSLFDKNRHTFNLDETGTTQSTNNSVGSKNEDVVSSSSVIDTTQQNSNNEKETNMQGDIHLTSSARTATSSRQFIQNNFNTCMFRIYCKERPPVGIPVIEHLEVNVSPLLIKLTNRFYKSMITFFFDDSASPTQNVSQQLASQPVNTSLSQNNSLSLQRNVHRNSYHVSSMATQSVNKNSNNSCMNLKEDLNLTNSTLLSSSSSNVLLDSSSNVANVENANNLNSSLVQSPTKIKHFFNR